MVEPTELEREQAFHEEFIQHRTQNFVGRKDKLKELEKFVKAPGNFPLIVEGQAGKVLFVEFCLIVLGAGKSALMAYFVAQQKANSSNHVISHFVGASPASTDITKTLRKLCEEIVNECGLWETVDGKFFSLPTNILESDDFQTLTDKFAEILKSADKGLCGKKLVIVIDAVNQIHNENDKNHPLQLKWIPSKIPSSVRLLISCLHGSEAIEACKSRGFPILEIGQLVVRDRQEIVTQILRYHNKRLDGGQVCS